MPGVPLEMLVRHLRSRAARDQAGSAPDAELLRRYVGQQDAAAFEALVRRHGPTVWGVCRRVLRHAQDAEDAFQATFLALVRGAGSIGRRQSVGGWLYRVAYRVSVKAKARAAKRVGHGPDGLEEVAGPPAVDPAWRDLRPVLDEEVNRLPERYRLPVILCYLDGKTYTEAAAHLGCPRGTVVTWLARARRLLRRRLSRRGLGLAAVLAAPCAPAAVPAGLVHAVTRGVASAQVVKLTEEVLRAMIVSKLKIAAVLVLAVGLAAGGTGALARPAPAGETPQAGSAEPPRPAAAARPKTKNELRHWVGYDTRESGNGPELVVVYDDGSAVTLRATADAAVIGYLADGAYGPTVVPLNVNLADTNRALVRFEPPPGGVIVKAELVLRLAADLRLLPPEPFLIGIHEVTTPWDERTVTWQTQPTFAARPTATAVADGRAKELHADVTSLVRRMAAGGSRHGWLLKVVHPLPETPAADRP
jgi:RNA polymerase sigma factor (sigma-70 family)